ncbi:hypothetical protein Salat_1213600 [Sesamum alatum]|uniref:Uncharacterized protein n=1 Tax=Sesamum alatum TaxID=300844 RepID=A0AAE1YFD5_9LAMI|nr:hypothetical protein Salat_1213600 [Sesamum alatum]
MSIPLTGFSIPYRDLAKPCKLQSLEVRTRPTRNQRLPWSSPSHRSSDNRRPRLSSSVKRRTLPKVLDGPLHRNPDMSIVEISPARSTTERPRRPQIALAIPRNLAKKTPTNRGTFLDPQAGERVRVMENTRKTQTRKLTEAESEIREQEKARKTRTATNHHQSTKNARSKEALASTGNCPQKRLVSWEVAAKPHAQGFGDNLLEISKTLTLNLSCRENVNPHEERTQI